MIRSLAPSSLAIATPLRACWLLGARCQCCPSSDYYAAPNPRFSHPITANGLSASGASWSCTRCSLHRLGGR
ncbi:unnamed protein product [Closterium sp. Naga37s-1]|nr:unnamed protein product [Closterium sp. Naga37s-1]